MSVLILAMLQDKAMVASKHYLVETEAKSKGVRGSFFLYLLYLGLEIGFA